MNIVVSKKDKRYADNEIGTYSIEELLNSCDCGCFIHIPELHNCDVEELDFTNEEL